MGNSPINYTDPSGHLRIQDGDQNDRFSQSLYEEYVPNDGSDDGGGLPDPIDRPDEDDEDDNVNYDGDNEDCTFWGQCDLQYHSFSFGLDVPTIMMLGGAGISYVKPEIGLPIALIGAILEICPLTGNVLCLVGKLSSFGVVVKNDHYGNWYVGPEYSLGKSMTPFFGASYNPGFVVTNDGHSASEAEMEQNLSGISFSAGSIVTFGASWSPGAKYPYSQYLVGVPEIVSVNAHYAWMVYDNK